MSQETALEISLRQFEVALCVFMCVCVEVIASKVLTDSTTAPEVDSRLKRKRKKVYTRRETLPMR